MAQGDKKHHPYLWDGKKLRDLGTFGGPDGDTASINDAGEVVGWGGDHGARMPPVDRGRRGNGLSLEKWS